jgi:hypothetical protein
VTSEHHARGTSSPDRNEAPPNATASDVGGLVLSRVLPAVALVLIVVMIIVIVVSR